MALTGSGGYHYLFSHPGVRDLCQEQRVQSGAWLGYSRRRRLHRGRAQPAYPGQAVSVGGVLPATGCGDCAPARLVADPDWLLHRQQSQDKGAATGDGGGGPLDAGTVARIRAALVYIDCEERDPWLEIELRYSTGAGKQAYLWCEWAQQSDKFDLKDSARVWRSFKPKNDYITLDTVFARWGSPDGRSEIRNSLAQNSPPGCCAGPATPTAALMRNCNAPTGWGRSTRRLNRPIPRLLCCYCPCWRSRTRDFEAGADALPTGGANHHESYDGASERAAGHQPGRRSNQPVSGSGGVQCRRCAPLPVRDVGPDGATGSGKSGAPATPVQPATNRNCCGVARRCFIYAASGALFCSLPSASPPGLLTRSTVTSEVWDGKLITIDADELKLPDPGVDGRDPFAPPDHAGRYVARPTGDRDETFGNGPGRAGADSVLADRRA